MSWLFSFYGWKVDPLLILTGEVETGNLERDNGDSLKLLL